MQFGINKKDLAYNRCSNTSKRQMKTRLGGNFTTIGTLQSRKVTLSKIKPQLQINTKVNSFTILEIGS